MVLACLRLRAAGTGVARSALPAAGREALLHRCMLPSAQKEWDSGASACTPSAGGCAAPLPGRPSCASAVRGCGAWWAFKRACGAWWLSCEAAGCRALGLSCGAAGRDEPPARRYVGTEGVYTHTVAYERDAACAMCSAGVPFRVRASDTLQQARRRRPRL